MPPTSLEQIIPELRDAIGPVILISGVGLLLLTMTNRLGRAIDRARQLKAELAKRTEAEREHLQAQVAIIYQRAKLIRMSITLAAMSALLAAALVVVLFLAALLRWENVWLVSLIFITCMVSLIASLVAFIRDINLSLRALKLELGSDREPKAGDAI
jgi:multidrug efflux pump subunit AcrB